MTDKPHDHGREIRDTVLKSGLTGVAATALAITVFSPAGFGGIVGTSLASGFGLDTNSASADDPYASLPPYPAPLSAQELSDIHNELARTTASLEITRAATEAKIERIRSLALGDATTFASMRLVEAGDGLQASTGQTETLAAAAPSAQPVVEAAAPAPESFIQPAAEHPEPAPAQAQATLTPVSFVGGPDPSYRDRHLELADLFLAHETY